MTERKLVFVILCCCTSVVLCCDTGLGFQNPDRADQAASLNGENFSEWRDRIRATESELVWQNLPWATSYHEGLRQAAAKNKPLLLWVMNGHPMGCT